MKSHYFCSTCKLNFEATTEYFVPSFLKKGEKNPNLNTLPKCKKCAQKYSAEWRKKIRKGFDKPIEQRFYGKYKQKSGTIYIIGTNVKGSPYKIGSTSGISMCKRLVALQTSHWMELIPIWKSDYIDNVCQVEKKLHEYFNSKKVRGEWFQITKKDVEKIPKLIKEMVTN